MTIRTKINTIFFLAIFTMIGMFAFYLISANEMHNRIHDTQQIDQFAKKAGQLNIITEQFISTGDIRFVDAWNEKIHKLLEIESRIPEQHKSKALRHTLTSIQNALGLIHDLYFYGDNYPDAELHEQLMLRATSRIRSDILLLTSLTYQISDNYHNQIHEIHHRQRFTFLILMVPAILIIGLLTFQTRRYLFESLSRLLKGTHEVSKGNLNTKIEITHEDEYALLAEKFNEMTEQLRLREESEARLKRELKQRADELTASNAELENFAYVASHDLQEPLRMVTSFMDRLEKRYSDKLDDKARQYIHFATDGAKRMRQTILDLLEFSRVGRVDLKVEHVDTAELMDSIKSTYSQKLKETGGGIHYENLPVVTGVKSQLMQLFQNMISNSLKYKDESRKPVIRIEANETEKHWIFIFSDNGIGIPEEYSEKVFGLFQRLHNSSEYSGTGLGLAICRKVAELHGGSISLIKSDGPGAVFELKLKKNHFTELKAE